MPGVRPVHLIKPVTVRAGEQPSAVPAVALSPEDQGLEVGHARDRRPGAAGRATITAIHGEVDQVLAVRREVRSQRVDAPVQPLAEGEGVVGEVPAESADAPGRPASDHDAIRRVAGEQDVDAATLRLGRGDVPYCAVKDGAFEARLSRAAAYQLLALADYDERRGPLLEYWKAQNGQQSGDPAKLARALITIASEERPPRRFIAGADAIATAEHKLADLKAQIEANPELSTSLAFD